MTVSEQRENKNPERDKPPRGFWVNERACGPPVSQSHESLRLHYILCFQAFRIFDHIEVHGFAFFQSAKTFLLDFGMMNKNVFAVIALDEAKTFFVAKPFYFSTSHSFPPPFASIFKNPPRRRLLIEGKLGVLKSVGASETLGHLCRVSLTSDPNFPLSSLIIEEFGRLVNV